MTVVKFRINLAMIALKIAEYQSRCMLKNKQMDETLATNVILNKKSQKFDKNSTAFVPV